MVLQQVLQSLRVRRKKVNKDVEKFTSITVGAAITMHRAIGQRLLLNDGEVVGIEESIF